jgi:hypothetical protein
MRIRSWQTLIGHRLKIMFDVITAGAYPWGHPILPDFAWLTWLQTQRNMLVYNFQAQKIQKSW